MSKEAKAPASPKTTPASPKAPAISMDPKFTGRLTGTLLGICAVVALLLGITNYATEPIITQMQAEKTRAAMTQVLPAETYEELSLDMPNVSAFYAAYNSNSGDKAVLAGYVVETTANGSQGVIRMVVGVDMDGNVTGVSVTKHSETANLGTKVVNDQSVLDRFIGMSHEKGEITVNAGTNRFDGVSGATVSSRGVTAGVNTALDAFAHRDAAVKKEG